MKPIQDIEIRRPRRVRYARFEDKLLYGIIVLGSFMAGVWFAAMWIAGEITK
jgi:hypothetical protein